MSNTMRCVLFALMVVCCLSEMCRAITLSEMDSYEKKSIDKLISHNSKLVYDDELMRLAETEAKRLAGIGSLAPPQITLSKNYFGYSFQTNEMKKKPTKANQRMCYNNFLKDSAVKIVNSDMDEMAQRRCMDMNVRASMSFAVGYGVAVDANGVGYAVRLFVTKQARTIKS